MYGVGTSSSMEEGKSSMYCFNGFTVSNAYVIGRSSHERQISVRRLEW